MLRPTLRAVTHSPDLCVRITPLPIYFTNPDEMSPASTFSEFHRDTKNLLAALWWVQSGQKRISEPDHSEPVISFLRYVRRQRQSLPRWRDLLRAVHANTVAAFDGEAVFSFHEFAVDACAERWNWLYDFVRTPEREGIAAAECDGDRMCAELVAARFAKVDHKWPFKNIDCERLTSFLEVEASRIDGGRVPGYLGIIADSDANVFRRGERSTDQIPPKAFKLGGKLLQAGEEGLTTDQFANAAKECGIDDGNAKAAHLTELRKRLQRIGITVPSDVRTTGRYRIEESKE